MKRFAAEIEEMLSYNKIFLTQNGPIRRNTNDTNFVKPTNENRILDKPQEMMEVDLLHETNYNLEDAICNFLKKPGQIYHLYVHTSGKMYFSMISPEEWGVAPHKYIGSWKYEFNSTWTNTTFRSR